MDSAFRKRDIDSEKKSVLKKRKYKLVLCSGCSTLDPLMGALSKGRLGLERNKHVSKEVCVIACVFQHTKGINLSETYILV